MMRLFHYRIEVMGYGDILYKAEGITFGATPVEAFEKVWNDYHIEKRDENAAENIWSLTIEETFEEETNTYELKREEEDE